MRQERLHGNILFFINTVALTRVLRTSHEMPTDRSSRREEHRRNPATAFVLLPLEAARKAILLLVVWAFTEILRAEH